VWQASDFHTLGCAFMASATLRDALDRLVHYNAVVYNVITCTLAERDGQAVLSYRAVDGKRDERAILQGTRWALVLDARRVKNSACCSS